MALISSEKTVDGTTQFITYTMPDGSTLHERRFPRPKRSGLASRFKLNGKYLTNGLASELTEAILLIPHGTEAEQKAAPFLAAELVAKMQATQTQSQAKLKILDGKAKAARRQADKIAKYASSAPAQLPAVGDPAPLVDEPVPHYIFKELCDLAGAAGYKGSMQNHLGPETHERVWRANLHGTQGRTLGITVYGRKADIYYCGNRISSENLRALLRAQAKEQPGQLAGQVATAAVKHSEKYTSEEISTDFFSIIELARAAGFYTRARTTGSSSYPRYEGNLMNRDGDMYSLFFTRDGISVMKSGRDFDLDTLRAVLEEHKRRHVPEFSIRIDDRADTVSALYRAGRVLQGYEGITLQDAKQARAVILDLLSKVEELTK